jgi:putative FmdB family regulatory protein
MPTYEYACTRCGQHVEVFQRLSEEPLTTCGACGGPLRKVFHPAGIVFKGSGFYATDNRSKPPASSGAGTNGDAKDKGTGDTKAEPSTSRPSSDASAGSGSPGAGAPAGGTAGGTGGASEGGSAGSPGGGSEKTS